MHPNHNHRNNSYGGGWNNQHRSRQKQHRNWNQHHDDKSHHQKNKYHKYEHKHHKREIIRNVHKVEIEKPKEFLIGLNSRVEEHMPKFVVNVLKSQEFPKKNQNILAQLKNKITPIQRLWTSYIKQYLNDSQFVQIYRNNNSLSYGNAQYGKTIIKYRQQEQELYHNQHTQAKIFSRAYFKLWQILSMNVFEGKQKQKLKIGCVAEGPGGFIHSLIDFRLKNGGTKDQIYAITLKITQNTRNAKDWSDSRGRKLFDELRMLGHKIELSYGSTRTGDLLKVENIDHFAAKDLEQNKCYLVTGDGGIECIGDQEFDYQEVFNVKLFLGQILTALKIQEKGGKFILKVYDCAFELTKQLLTLLCTFYQKVRMIKPITSRPGNSQKYILSQGFRGMSQDEEQQLKKLLTQWASIESNLSYFQNKEFVQKILDFPHLKNKSEIYNNLSEANQFFMEEQAQKLRKGLELAEHYNNDIHEIKQALMQTRIEEQISYAWEWCRHYGLAGIEVKFRGE